MRKLQTAFFSVTGYAALCMLALYAYIILIKLIRIFRHINVTQNLEFIKIFFPALIILPAYFAFAMAIKNRNRLMEIETNGESTQKRGRR